MVDVTTISSNDQVLANFAIKLSITDLFLSIVCGFNEIN